MTASIEGIILRLTEQECEELIRNLTRFKSEVGELKFSQAFPALNILQVELLKLV